MVGLAGLEPATPRLSSVCSNQLSYRPRWKILKSRNAEILKFQSPGFQLFKVSAFQLFLQKVVEACGFEPQTFCLQSRRSTN